jgi:hypothetical protein
MLFISTLSTLASLASATPYVRGSSNTTPSTNSLVKRDVATIPVYLPCPDGYTQFPITCTRGTHTFVRTPTCPDETKHYVAGLCYPLNPCRDFKGFMSCTATNTFAAMVTCATAGPETGGTVCIAAGIILAGMELGCAIENCI